MTPWVQRLIIANVVMFFVQQTMPGLVGQLAFIPAFAFSRPWTMITYMFLHGGLGHIFFNMLALYFFGPRVEQRLGSERFSALYFISGISGALLSMVFARQSPIVGASAAVFGVMLAFARFWPRDKIYIYGVLPLEARWLIALSVAYAVFSGLRGSTGGVADFAHLGGFAGGYLYLLYIERTKGARQFRKQAVAGPPRDSLGDSWKRVDASGVHDVNRDEVNRILDKISATGIASLTPQERLFLSNFVPMDDRTPPVPPS